jgi:hypothetical protein
MSGPGPTGDQDALPAGESARGRRWVSEFAQAGGAAAPRWSSPVWLAHGRCGARDVGAERRVRAELAVALAPRPLSAPRAATAAECHAALQRALRSAAPPETWRRLAAREPG